MRRKILVLLSTLTLLFSTPIFGLELEEDFDSNDYSDHFWNPLATNCNHTWVNGGGWSGSAAKFTTPTAEGYCGLTSFGTITSSRLNVRFLIKVSQLYSTTGWCDGNKNIIILKTGQETNNRSIGFHTRRYANKGTINVCEEIECEYADGLFYWELGPYYDQWVCVEYELQTDNDIFRVYVTTLDGDLNETVVATTGSMGTYTADSIQILGGYYQVPCSSYDADRYWMIDELKISTSGYIGPPAGFVAGADTTPPAVTISTSPYTVYTDNATIEWTDSDAVGVTSRKWRIGSAPDATHGTTTDGATSTDVSGLSKGANTVYIGAGDAAGNWGSDSVVITYKPLYVFLTNPAGSGLAQANPNASLGGYRSTTALSTVSMKNIFDDITVLEATLGDTEYRLLDVFNSSPSIDALKVQLYVIQPTSSSDTEITLGYNATNQPHADAWDGEELADEDTAPASPAMTFGSYTRASPLSLGTIPAGQSKRICIKRVVDPLSAWDVSDKSVIGMRWIEE